MKLFVFLSPSFGLDTLAVAEADEEKAKECIGNALRQNLPKTQDELDAWENGVYNDLKVLPIGGVGFFPNS